MRTIKPACLSVLTRPIEHRRHFFLGVSVLTHIPLRGEAHLGAEQSLWPMLAEFAPDFMEDGIPRIRSEFLLYAKAYPPEKPDELYFDCGIRVGDIAKKARIHGRRVLQGSQMLVEDPAVITQLSPENAYGGSGYPANPNGTGDPSSRDERDLLFLPTVELLTHPWHKDPQQNHPALFTALDLTHPQRRQYAGTYGDEWLKQDYPGLPRDAGWRVYNSAAENQQQEEPFAADAGYDLVNLSPYDRHIRNRLPEVQPRIMVRREGQEQLEELSPKLRTLLFLPEADSLVLVWQSQCELETDDARDLELIALGFEHLHRPKSLAHYEEVVSRRLDEEEGIFAMLDDSVLVPEEMGYDPLLAETDPDPEDPQSMSARLKRRISACMKEGHDEVVAHELDPADHGPPEKLPEPPETPPLRDMGPYMRELLERAERDIEEAKGKQATEVAETSRFLDEQKLDGALVERETRGEVGVGGPPPSVEKRTLQDLKAIDSQAREQGEPVGEVEEMLADQSLHQEWRSSDRQMLEGYRVAAHLQPPVQGTSGSEMERQRQNVEQALQRGESLAGLDLTGANLSGLDLSGQDLNNTLMESVSLRNARLDRANLTNAVLAHADLRGATMIGCDFSRANLGKANLEGADASGARFSETELSGANLQRLKLQGADLAGLQLQQANLQQADLAGAKLDELFCFESSLQGATLDRSRLNEAQFVDCDLSGTSWQGAVGENTLFLNLNCPAGRFSSARLKGSRWVGEIALSGADFSHAEITEAYFAQGSDLSGVSFERADLSNTILSACLLKGASLRAAVLRETQLKDAILVDVDMNQVNLMEGSLQNADLSGADLTDAHLYGTDLVRILTDQKTRSSGAIYTNARIHPRRDLQEEGA